MATPAVPSPSPSAMVTATRAAARSPTTRAYTPTPASPPTATATPAPARLGPPRVLAGHTGPVAVLAWAPDGARFATTSGANGSPDTTVRLWDADGRPLAAVEEPALVRTLAWSPDGRMLATGAADGTVRLRDTAGAPRVTFDLAPDPVLSLAWSPDGQLLAIGGIAIGRRQAGALPGVVHLARPDGQVLAALSTQSTGGKFLHLAWSPDGQLLAAGAIDFRLWRADGTLVATLGGGVPAPAMAWSPDGRLLAIGNENSAIAFYDTTGQPVGRLRANGPVLGLAFSPDGATLAFITGGVVSLVSTENLAAAPRVIHYQEGGPRSWSVSNLAWSPDGGRLATATRDGAPRVWRADGTPLAIYEGCPGMPERLAWAPDGAALLAGSRDHAVCLWRERP